MSQPNQMDKDLERLDWPTSLVMIGILTLMAWEWFRPLLSLTYTYTIQPFILFFFIALLVQRLKLLPWIRAGIMSFLLLHFIHHLYIQETFFSTEWLKYLFSQIIYSTTLFIERDLYSHPFIVATLYFFLLIWFAARIIYNMVMKKHQTLYFFVLTISFLAILDTFSPYESMYPIIRTFLYGFVLLTFNQIRRLMLNSEKSHKFAERSFPVLWVLSSIIVVVVVTAFAFMAPKAAPSWPDPVTFLKGYSKYAGQGVGGVSIKRIGYGNNDQHLGGPFIQDESLVFVADTQARGYWRGESKDIYTGKGWVQSESEKILKIMQPVDNRLQTDQINLFLYGRSEDSKVNRETVTSTIQFEEPRFATLFYTGDPLEVTVNPTNMNDALLHINRQSGKLTMYQDLELLNYVHGYSVQSEVPTFSTLALLEASMDQVPGYIRQQYTQLPDTLPDRVRELAVDITEEAETDYEKVKRIERFFGSNGYEYNIEEASVPGEEDDYVDQFLFETMKGYCDNFSSAMVVMLRTIDIPARWVKGFTFGDITASLNGNYTTEVRNLNAHSWVEVYFPDIGWVPFEPTRSFSNPYTFERDDLESTAGSDGNLPFDRLEDPFGEELDQNEESALLSGARGYHDSWWMNRKVWTFSGCFLLLVLTLIFFFRKNLLLTWAIMRYREASDQHAFFHVYSWLIRYLGRFILPRDSSQTMREYALALEEKINIEELKPITRLFEKMRYGRSQDDAQAQHAYQIWKTIVNKLKSYYS